MKELNDVSASGFGALMALKLVPYYLDTNEQANQAVPG